MNGLQRAVVIVFSIAGAALLYLEVPRHGLTVEQETADTRRWDATADSLRALANARWNPEHPAAPAEEVEAWRARFNHDLERRIGPRPVRDVFLPRTRTHEVLLREFAPVILVGVACYVLAGHRRRPRGQGPVPPS